MSSKSCVLTYDVINTSSATSGALFKLLLVFSCFSDLFIETALEYLQHVFFLFDADWNLASTGTRTQDLQWERIRTEHLMITANEHSQLVKVKKGTKWKKVWMDIDIDFNNKL